jgi:lysophospholipase L1-like esterase
VERCLGMVISAALLAGLAACSVAGDDVSHRSDDETRRATTVAEGHAGAATAREDPDAGERTGAVAAPATWDYVALGDSLAAGLGAREGYVALYAAHIESDTGARVEVLNLGVSGQTSSELLHALRNDESMRRALAAAEVVTFNIGINDLGHAGEAYERGACGGDDGQGCLRAAVAELEENRDAIVAEILGLRSTRNTVIRTAGLGYTPRVAAIFEPYVARVDRHIAAASAEYHIPYAQPHLHDRHMSPDGVHPNDDGHEVIADGLRELGYEPLGPPR